MKSLTSLKLLYNCSTTHSHPSWTLTMHLNSKLQLQSDCAATTVIAILPLVVQLHPKILQDLYVQIPKFGFPVVGGIQVQL